MVAIGPSTKTEMEKYGMKVFGIAAKPDPQSLLDVLKNRSCWFYNIYISYRRFIKDKFYMCLYNFLCNLSTSPATLIQSVGRCVPPQNKFFYYYYYYWKLFSVKVVSNSSWCFIHMDIIKYLWNGLKFDLIFYLTCFLVFQALVCPKNFIFLFLRYSCCFLNIGKKNTEAWIIGQIRYVNIHDQNVKTRNDRVYFGNCIRNTLLNIVKAAATDPQTSYVIYAKPIATASV